MPRAKLFKSTVWEDGGAALMARVVGNDAANVTQASLSAITQYAYDTTNAPTTDVGVGTLTIANVIFDTLQTDDRWTVDSTGYNFRHDVPATVFATGGGVYRVEYKFEPASGDNFYVVFQVTAKAISSS